MAVSIDAYSPPSYKSPQTLTHHLNLKEFQQDNTYTRPNPKFKDQYIGQYPAYIAEPSGAEIKNSKALLYLTDSAGICHNSRLLADEFAAWGYLTIVCFNTGVIREDGASKADSKKTYLSEENTIDTIETILQYLINDRQITIIGAIGYSSGAPWVLSLLAAGAVSAGFIAHPTHITVSMLKHIQ